MSLTHSSNGSLRFANFLAFNINPAYQAIADEIGRKLNIPTSFHEGQCFSQFFDHQFDVGFICGLPYSQLSRRPDTPFELLVAPVLAGARYENKPVYFSDLIVHKDSDYHTFADLQGTHFAYNEVESYSGYYVFWDYLLKQGFDWEFFGDCSKSGAHQKSMEGIASGKFTVAAIDSHAIDVELKLLPELANQIRVIDTMGPSPIPPVVVNKHLPDELKADLQNAFLQLANNSVLCETLNEFGFAGFCAVDDTHYDTLRSRICRTIDFLA